MKSLHIFTLFVISLLACGITHANDHDYHLGFRIAPRVSTLGGGLEVAKGLTPWFGLRGGVNYFTWSYDGTESDIEYDLELELKSFGMFADFHPFKQAFRVSLGFLLNGNGFEGKGKLVPGTTFEIGDTSYNTSQIDSVGFDLSYNTFAPYAGIGWDTTFGDYDNWGFTFDIGILFSGSPKASFSVDHNLPGPQAAILMQDINKEKDEIQESLDQLEIYPVISAGLVYQF